MAWVFPGVIVFFNLALPFPNSFDEMGSHIRLSWDGRMDLNLSRMDLRNDQHMA